jgi:uridine kinase
VLANRRADLLLSITELIKFTDGRTVAIDGVDSAGKTTFADEFAFTLVRASVDGFNNSRAIRYRRGRNFISAPSLPKCAHQSLLRIQYMTFPSL